MPKQLQYIDTLDATCKDAKCRLHDSDRYQLKPESYMLRAGCGYCNWKGMVELSRGHYLGTGLKCPTCGTPNLTKILA